MTTAVWLEVHDGRVRSSSLPAVTAARQVAEKQPGKVIGIVIGAQIGDAATDAARFVDEVRVFDHPVLASPLAETHAPLLAAAVQAVGAKALVATASSFGKDVLPRTAALLSAGMASDVVAVLDGNKFRRPTYAGNALSDVEITTQPVIVSVRQSAFAAAAPAAASGTVTAQDAGAIDPLGAEVLSLKGTVSARPDLSEAAIVVSGGRGMKTTENFKALEELTDLLGGALGASRAACDAGLVPHELQVGQTGKMVAPKLYIAVALSGAIQHLAGMKNSKVIVAINKDPEAPIFQVADYGLVASWEKAVPELIAAVKKKKGIG